MGDEIKIRSSRAEFSSIVVIGSSKYMIVTESSGGREPNVTTRVYLKGEVLASYSLTVDAKDLKKVDELMMEQHKKAASILKQTMEEKAKKPVDYLTEVKALLASRKSSEALALLREAIERHPNNPFMLSYYGCLLSVVSREHEKGIMACQKAIRNLKQSIPFGQEFFYPTFYLNLGRAYMAAGNKSDAVEAFAKGLSIDPSDAELQAEMKKLGKRKSPPVPFLKRSNPINKYIGILINKK